MSSAYEGVNGCDILMDCPCCAGEDHAIREGGSHVNLIQLEKMAEWPYLALVNFLVADSADHPLACAVVCDECLAAGRKIRYAMAGVQGDNGAEYYRVSLDSLRDPEFYWPDHHPDHKLQHYEGKG